MYALLNVCLTGVLTAASHAASAEGVGEHAAEKVEPAVLPAEGEPTKTEATALPTIDPLAFFDALVERYRRIELYTDIAHLIESVQSDGRTTSTTETQVACEVRSGELRVDTGSDQLRRSLGIQSPVPMTPMMRDVQEAYWMWLAPHMTLRFSDDPLAEFRDGVDDGFTPTRAEAVTVDEKVMVQIELRSNEHRCRSRDDEATFDLYVDPNSMLIERIEGQQTLPGGARQHTTWNITPLSVSDATTLPIDDATLDTLSDVPTAPPDDAGPAAAAGTDDPHADACESERARRAASCPARSGVDHHDVNDDDRPRRRRSCGSPV